ncbi:MAG: transcription initiation factor IIB [Candidatus Lokiarchaeota archaeon]|nr:transcription initiation factor IIB [Candidatus Lokiarchaeota archaeon]
MGLNTKKNILLNVCPECGGSIIPLIEKGDIVCNQCGLVIGEKNVDFSHNGRRAYTNQEKSNREQTGAPISILLPDMGLSTVIDRSKINNPDLKRAAKWNTRITWQKRNLLIASTELKRISTNLNLPIYIREDAMRLYREAFKKKLLRGRSINAMVAACLYLACRRKQLPRTLQEITNEASANAKDVRRSYTTLLKEFNLKSPSTDPVSLIPRYINDLELDSEIEQLTTKILNSYKARFSISGKDPKGLCAGAIYLASKIKNKDTTQQLIVETVGITEVTLRSRYKELKNKLKITLPT